MNRFHNSTLGYRTRVTQRHNDVRVKQVTWILHSKIVLCEQRSKEDKQDRLTHEHVVDIFGEAIAHKMRSEHHHYGEKQNKNIR